MWMTRSGLPDDFADGSFTSEQCTVFHYTSFVFGCTPAVCARLFHSHSRKCTVKKYDFSIFAPATLNLKYTHGRQIIC
jgi:hypothetical protein